MIVPFGAINIAAEMAVTMGMDPRPYLTEREIENQARVCNLTVEQWHQSLDTILANMALPECERDCPF